MNIVQKIVGVSVLLSVIACSGNDSDKTPQGPGVYLSGTVGFPDKSGKIILEEIRDNKSVAIDTIELSENYTFKSFVSLQNPGFYRINFYGKQQVVLILDDEDVTVNVDGNNPQGFVEITGSTDMDLIKEIRTLKQSIQETPQFIRINDEFSQASAAGDKEKMEALRKEYLELEKGVSDQIAAKLESFGPSLASIEILRGSNIIDKDQYFDTYISVAETNIKAYPELQMVKEFSSMVEQMKVVAIGAIAPDLSLPDPQGNIVTLSSFRGKYVLVDFWAKWCRPCRAENPNVVRAYKKFNPYGFEVVGVSLDRNREDWVQAIKEDGLVWTHMSDLKFWQSEAARIYNINAIPFAVLLDPEGKIIAKNLRGSALDSKLEEIFADKM